MDTEGTEIKPRSGRGGFRPGAGRKPRGHDRVSTAVRERSAKNGKLPHELLLEWARGTVKVTDVVVIEGQAIEVKRKLTLAERLDAAKAAAPYYAPKLAQVESNSNVTHGVSVELRALMQQMHSEGAGRLKFSAPRLAATGGEVVGEAKAVNE